MPRPKALPRRVVGPVGGGLAPLAAIVASASTASTPGDQTNGGPPLPFAFTLATQTGHLLTTASATSAGASSSLILARQKRASAAAAAHRAALDAQAAAAASSSSTATSNGTSNGRKRQGSEAPSASSSTKPKAKRAKIEAPAAPPTEEEEPPQYEVERLLQKRVRLERRTVLKKLGVPDGNGVAAEEICVKHLAELLEEEKARLASAPVAAASMAASSSAATSARSQARSSSPAQAAVYGRLNPVVQLPVVEYLIRWKGYTSADDNWEPTWNIHHLMIREFEMRLAERKHAVMARPTEEGLALLAQLSTHPTRADIVDSHKAKPKTKDAPPAAAAPQAAAAPAPKPAAAAKPAAKRAAVSSSKKKKKKPLSMAPRMTVRLQYRW